MDQEKSGIPKNGDGDLDNVNADRRALYAELRGPVQTCTKGN